MVWTTGLEMGGMGAWVVGSTVRRCVGPSFGSLLILGPNGDVRGVGSVVGSVGEMNGDVVIADPTPDSGDCSEG